MYCYAFLSIQGGGMYLMIRLPVNEFLMENRCVSIRLMAIAQHLKRKTYWEKATSCRALKLNTAQGLQAAQYRAFYFWNAQRLADHGAADNNEEQRQGMQVPVPPCPTPWAP